MNRWDCSSKSTLRKSSGWTVKKANEVTGGLSSPGKLDCHSFNLPASACRVGGKLRKKRGSVCEMCYAADTVNWLKQRSIAVHGGGFRHNRYAFPVVKTAMERRLKLITHKMWVEAMSFLILWYEHPSWSTGLFRWFDSGDLQGKRHYRRILAVCRKTDPVKHWLPSKEGVILEWKGLPGNLCQRLSMPMRRQKPPVAFRERRWTTSTADSGFGQSCPALNQGHSCRGCQDCWDRTILNIDYGGH